MKKKISNTYRIAAYIRVSTEEQATNPEGSIKNQEQRIREYVRHRNMDSSFGEIIDVYCDPGDIMTRHEPTCGASFLRLRLKLFMMTNPEITKNKSAPPQKVKYWYTSLINTFGLSKRKYAVW